MSVIDDPIHEPHDDHRGAEAYQLENLPTDSTQIFKFGTYDIEHLAAEMEGTAPLDGLVRLYAVRGTAEARPPYAELHHRVWCDPQFVDISNGKATSNLISGKY